MCRALLGVSVYSVLVCLCLVCFVLFLSVLSCLCCRPCSVLGLGGCRRQCVRLVKVILVLVLGLPRKGFPGPGVCCRVVVGCCCRRCVGSFIGPLGRCLNCTCIRLLVKLYLHWWCCSGLVRYVSPWYPGGNLYPSSPSRSPPSFVLGCPVCVCSLVRPLWLLLGSCVGCLPRVGVCARVLVRLPVCPVVSLFSPRVVRGLWWCLCFVPLSLSLFRPRAALTWGPQGSLVNRWLTTPPTKEEMLGMTNDDI